MIETVFRSEDVAPADRFPLWRELMARTHAPLDISTDDPRDFRATQRLLDLGTARVWPTDFQPARFVRTPKLIRQSDPEGVHVSLPVRGVLRVTRNGHEIAYAPGSLCVIDSSRPIEVHAGDGPAPQAGIGLELPRALLTLPRDGLDRLTGYRLSSREGFGGLLAQFLVRLTDDTASFGPDDGPHLAGIAADLVSSLFAHVLDTRAALPPETRHNALRLRIRAFLRENLHDPGLTPSVIAAAHHISVRHLHSLFRDESETVAAHLRHLRLERARRLLTDPAWRDVPVGHIAAACGFSEHSVFTRVFKTAYGMTPRDYRHRAQPAVDPPPPPPDGEAG
ncbi:AraC-like ligand-binding domain-containing protein [Streptomyces specialis]|uniref:AraC-like ligand-binding domain-containing protein n=1 Tax=Streptomyces specialis TaxID=498367 RepID=UPI00073FA410|nr:helix-turn-helix domain-containing protein [Streptomyces specialis]